MGTYALPMSMQFAAMQGMTEQQQAMFMAQYNIMRKDETVAILLAVFLGGFGAHRFYMGDIGPGLLYVVFSWTLIPHIVALVECFWLADRVREYNALCAEAIACQIRGLPDPRFPWVG